jgi:hypothetical protein
MAVIPSSTLPLTALTFWAKDSLEIKRVIMKRRDILKRSKGYNFEKQ